VRETLQRGGLIEVLGEENIFRSTAQAVEAVTASLPAV